MKDIKKVKTYHEFYKFMVTKNPLYISKTELDFYSLVSLSDLFYDLIPNLIKENITDITQDDLIMKCNKISAEILIFAKTFSSGDIHTKSLQLGYEFLITSDSIYYAPSILKYKDKSDNTESKHIIGFINDDNQYLISEI